MKASDWKTRERLGDAAIEAKYLELMNGTAKILDDVFNGGKTGADRETGFVLLLFDFAEGGRVNYISNAVRDDVVKMLKQQLARFEGQPDLKGSA